MDGINEKINLNRRSRRVTDQWKDLRIEGTEPAVNCKERKRRKRAELNRNFKEGLAI